MDDPATRPETLALDRRTRRRLAVLVVAGLVCLQFSGWSPDSAARDVEGYDPSLNEQVTRGEEGSAMRQAGALLLGLAALVVFLPRRAGTARGPVLGPLSAMLLVVAAYGLLSVAWAEVPAMSLKRWVAAMLLGAGAVAACRGMTFGSLVRLVFVVTLIEAGVAVLFELASGAFASASEGYRFSGGLHPNALALVSAFLAASGVAVWRQRRQPVEGAAAAAGIALGLSVLVMTRSRTTLVSLLAAGLVVFLVSSRPARFKGLVAGALALLLAALVLSPSLRAPVLSAALLGRDTDTDRTPIWLDCLEYAGQRPLFGYGFNGFWTPTHVEDIASMEKWGVAEAHSAYLEVLLDGGYVGLLLTGVLLALSLFLALRRWRTTAATEDGFALAVLVFAALHGVLESGAVRPGLLMFVTVAAMAHAGSPPLVRAAASPVTFRPGALVPRALPDPTVLVPLRRPSR